MKQEKIRRRKEAEKDEDVEVTTTKLQTTSHSSCSFFTNTTSPIIIKPTHRTEASRYHNKQKLEVVVQPIIFSYHNSYYIQQRQLYQPYILAILT
ncbi:hypothetical protein DOY81_004406 [Sarcophaga bullata]|nr:hypothetical protein DOY81_004406 [Sarcophaga bullata]